MTPVPFEGLYVNGAGPQRLILDKNKLSFEELDDWSAKEIKLKGAVFETQRRFGREFLWLGILLFFAGGIGLIFIILFYYVKKEVLVVTTSEGMDLTIKGKKEILDDLHYLIQKQCLKKLDETDKKKSARRREKSIDKKKGDVLLLTCPECGSDRLYYEAAYHTGSKYHCKECDYIGAFVIEKVVDSGD